MRNVARLKMGYYPLPESEGIKLRALLSFTRPASVIDPCVGEGTALHLVTGDAEIRRYGVELDAERARLLLQGLGDVARPETSRAAPSRHLAGASYQRRSWQDDSLALSARRSMGDAGQFPRASG